MLCVCVCVRERERERERERGNNDLKGLKTGLFDRFQAFAAAQLNGDWSQLESEMSAVLGPEAVGITARPPDVLAQASQIIQVSTL